MNKVITAEDRKMSLPWWGVLCVFIVAYLLVSLFDHFGNLALARPALFSISIIAITIAMRWKLKCHAWFWIIMAAFTALHVLLVLLVPWTTNWIPALVIIPIGIADSYAMLWVVAIVGKYMKKRNTPAKHAHSHRSSAAAEPSPGAENES